MLPREMHFYNSDAELPVAVVTLRPAAERGLTVIDVKHGRFAADSEKPVQHGPFPAEQLEARFTALVDQLQDTGYLRAGTHDALTALDQGTASVRARAALRLGWRRYTPAVPRLVARLAEAPEETCSVLDALGLMGDVGAAPAIRPQVGRKLLSRRRSAVEALRLLGDETGLAEARNIALERLPASLRPFAESDALPPSGAVELLMQLGPPQQGLAADTLYELATPPALAAVRQWLAAVPFEQVHYWRYAKSIYKRSMLRLDGALFGWLSHAIEERGRQAGSKWAEIKSGYDGQTRVTRIFSIRTRAYLQRQAWRHLQNLARFRSELYAATAAEVLVHYTPADQVGGNFANSLLLHRILWGSTDRFFRGPSGRWRARVKPTKPAKVLAREEMYPELWGANPRAYLRLLGGALLPEVQRFAHTAVTTRHPEILAAASNGEIVAMLQAPFEPTLQLALGELERRFDPEQPDWSLLSLLLRDERPNARILGQRWLRVTAPRWLSDPERIATWLELPLANQRALVAELTVPTLDAHPELRGPLADRLLARLAQPEIAPGLHDAMARIVCEVLAPECNARLGAVELSAWLEAGSPAAQAAAAYLLAARRDAVAELGMPRLAQLAQHDMVAVRAAAQRLLGGAEADLRADPSLLFVLVESEWEDTRKFALGLLQNRLGAAVLGFEGILGLLDSTRTDVQDAGAELARQHLADLPMGELAQRLLQHPHPHVRTFALEMLTRHLPPGAAALREAGRFCRTVLFDLWPQAAVKRGIVEFLAARGLVDADQAALASAILGDVVRMQGRGDFERALEALVRIKLAFPDVPSTVQLTGGAA